MNKTSIFVAILTGRERVYWVHPDLLLTCMRMPVWQQKTGSNLTVSIVNSVTPVDAARNTAVKYLLESGAEWLLQIDNDVVPPQNVLNILDTIEDRKIVGLPCGIEKSPGEMTLALANRLEHSECLESYTGMPQGWAKIDVVGTGCFLAHRDVFSAIAYPWYECRVVDGFHTLEDFTFCDKARAAGFEIWTHSGFPCGHYKTVDITRHMIARHGPLVKRP
jgi:GT2 family glycosyltransferase